MMKHYRKVEVPDGIGYKVGDVISFTLLDGEEVESMAVKQEQDGMIFCTVDSISKLYPMFKEIDKESCGWLSYQDSELRKSLNSEIIDRFPGEIRENMVQFENGDFLRIPTEMEVLGGSTWGEKEPESIIQWVPMKERRNRACSSGYWLSNKCSYSNTLFAAVTSSGYGDYQSAFDDEYVRLVFKLKDKSVEFSF